MFYLEILSTYITMVFTLYDNPIVKKNFQLVCTVLKSQNIKASFRPYMVKLVYSFRTTIVIYHIFLAFWFCY